MTGLRDRKRGESRRQAGILLFALFLCSFAPGAICFAETVTAATDEATLRETVNFFASLGDRTTGSAGNTKAADYITERLQAAEPAELDNLDFLVPMLHSKNSMLEINGRTIPISPLAYNAITPENLPTEGLTGSLIYVGHGELADFNGKEVRGAIVLMEFQSMKNWLNAASLGASALIYVNRDISPRAAFVEKEELSPIQFPCFWAELINWQLCCHKTLQLSILHQKSRPG